MLNKLLKIINNLIIVTQQAKVENHQVTNIYLSENNKTFCVFKTITKSIIALNLDNKEFAISFSVELVSYLSHFNVMIQ